MITFLKKYWAEILVIAVIGIILLLDAAPNMTWVNTDSDGIHYTYASQFLYPSHKGSAPLFLLLGNLFSRIPFGTEFWRMALISVISGTVGSLFILLIIRKKLPDVKYAKWYAIIGALVYGGSALAISQNTIVEAYPLVVAVSLAVYYFCLREKWLTASILIGVAGAIHPTAMLVIIPMLIAYKPLRNWKRLGVMACFVLFYLYVPLTNRPPYMWNNPNSSGGIFGFVNDSVQTAMMLSGQLSIYDFPKRLLDVISLLVVNFAILGLVPLFFAFKHRAWYRNVLLWIIAIPAIYFLTDLAEQTYVYLQPTIAFGAVAVGIGLSRLNKKWMMATAGCLIIFLGFNANYFDIGRTLDPNLSATEYYNVELAKVPDGQILMPQYGWEWAAIFRYNKAENGDIIPVCVDTLVSSKYQELLNQWGVKFADNHDEDRLTRQNYIALSIVSLNDNVWTTRTTTPETYGTEVVLAKDNENLLSKVPSKPPAQWHWKPSNPYDIITGAIEIKEWGFITQSNQNMFNALLIGSGGLLLILWITASVRKKNE